MVIRRDENMLRRDGKDQLRVVSVEPVGHHDGAIRRKQQVLRSRIVQDHPSHIVDLSADHRMIYNTLHQDGSRPAAWVRRMDRYVFGIGRRVSRLSAGRVVSLDLW